MPSLQDPLPKVELDPTAIRRALDTIRRISVPTSHNSAAEDQTPTIHLSNGNPKSAPSHSRPAELPPRGRNARKMETREELLARLLDPVLTLDETARVLDVCATTVRRYTNKGILPHERSKGNQRRFKLSHVLAFMEAQSQGDMSGL